MPDSRHSDVVVADYVASDDAACKELEVTASQFQFCGGLVKAAVHHYQSFDAKPGQFGAHVLLVAKHHPTSTICGVVAVAIKEATVHGCVRKCGFVFDLRVSKQFQRRGIGSLLTAEAETRCEQMGVSFLYLSVNNDNRKAKKLYARAGWLHASSRALVMQPLLLPQPVPPAATVRRLEIDEALQKTAAHFASRDLGLTPSGFTTLFHSKVSAHACKCSR